MGHIVDRIRSGDLPEHAEKAIVQGVMPLDPEELLLAIFLLGSKSEALIEESQESFAGVTDSLKEDFFADRKIDSELLAFYLRHFPFSPKLASVLLLNPQTPAEALKRIAPNVEAKCLDLIVNNQVKIQEEPSIIEALRRNPSLSITQARKLEEYEELLLKDLVSPAEELEHKSLEVVETEAIESAKKFVATFGKEGETTSQKKDEKECLEKKSDSMVKQIAEMSIPQKIQASIKGDREVRNLLVRDANKLVCCAVIKSPRVTEAEIEFYSNLRNVQTDVLRLIAMNRDWLKSYKIVSNLIKNPRTPLAFTMKLLPRLNSKDLKLLVRDKNIPEALRTMARRISRGSG